MTKTHFDELLEPLNKAIAQGLDMLQASVDSNSIRVHAAMENYLNIIIKLQIYSDPKVLTSSKPIVDSIINNMRFVRKVELLASLGVIDAITKGNLEYLNRVRVANAHPLLKKPFEVLNMKKMTALLTGLKQAILHSIDTKHISSAHSMDALSKLIETSDSKKNHTSPPVASAS